MVTKKKILLMDDDQIVIDVCREMFENLGYTAEFVYNGQEVLETLKTAQNEGAPFDLVIMDLTVPDGMGAEETIKPLREIDHDVKALVSSGFSYDSVMVDYKKFGFNGTIEKPYKLDELDEILQAIF
ncbi:response regulator [Desulfococcaceae bacterium HSG7]|nr:response regulator [Desulfococcaceae bacterium HSG9]MDM8553216.1 response regulator [Desulfococcaceae bacterium HSG7]